MGKSYAVRAWAKERNLTLVEINFEEQPRYQQLFEEDLVVDRVLDEISLLTGKNLRQPDHVLFMDEIQFAPRAITALRYFYEKAPSIPVVAASSLIEFALQEEGSPVGRVESLYVFPLSFFEFLYAIDKTSIADFLSEYDVSKGEPISPVVHNEILKTLRLYYQIGGMPKVLSTFLDTRDFTKVANEQSLIIKGYQDDFQKYARKAEWSPLQATMSRMGSLVGRTRVKFSSVGDEFSSGQIRRAIDLLDYALLVSRVYSTHTKELPLAVSAQHKYFKLLFVDIGLLHHILGFDWRTVSPSADLTDICEGRLAEQFVGQEIITARSGMGRYQLHYWDRPKRGSDAEVDYVIEVNGGPAPIEVKSGMRGKLRSLTQYIQELHPSKAVVLSQRNREQSQSIEFMPLYLACRLK